MAKLMVMIDFPDKSYDQLRKEVMLDRKFDLGRSKDGLTVVGVPKDRLFTFGENLFQFELIGIRP